MQRFKTIIVLMFIAVILLVPQFGVAAPVYRWVDENGEVHYGDQAPEGVEASRVDIKPNTVNSTSPAKSSASKDGASANGANEGEKPELSYAEQSRQDRAARQAESAEKARQTAINCETMRQQRDFVEPSPRVIVDDGKGGTRRLDDNERLDLLNEAKTFIEKNCNS